MFKQHIPVSKPRCIKDLRRFEVYVGHNYANILIKNLVVLFILGIFAAQRNTNMKYNYILFAAGLVCSSIVKAQEATDTRITYDLTTEASVGSGDYTAYQLVTNRHHVLATRPNTAYLRGAINLEHVLSKDFTLSGAVDVIASVHADHQLYLQQCYANLDYQKTFFLEVGSHEEKPVLRNDLLSSGSFVKGNNAKPIPQIHIGTKDFWTIPFTKGWLQANFDFGYGKLMDSGYREDRYKAASDVNLMYTTGAFYHQKHLYFRTNPTNRIFVTFGIQHVAQFGGTNYSREEGRGKTEEVVIKKKPANLKAMWNVVLPLGDNNYYDDEALEDWIYGNHLGLMTVQFGWNINEQHQLQVYYDDIFEDGSGMRKSNGWDGLWGVEYKNRAAGRQYIRGVVAEFFQTTNQSGPLHWDANDHPEPIRSQITDKAFGDDNYYNHMFYDSFAHYGMTPGNALITSPIYNKDGFTRYRDNRIKAWHLGINGEITDHLSYLVKGSYREGWGTYQMPLAEKHHSFDAMLQGLYNVGSWQFGAAYAFDKGNIYGDCSTFNFKIGYHGKIL